MEAQTFDLYRRPGTIYFSSDCDGCNDENCIDAGFLRMADL